METDPLSSSAHRVEAYLEQVLAPLTRRLSPFHRDELRRELRAHLWSRVDAYRELGMPQEDAVTEALRQFGGAEDFTREWRREWATTAQVTKVRDLWQVTCRALPLSLLAIVLACMPGIFVVYQVHAYGTESWWSTHFRLFSGGWYSELALLPIGLGLLLGRFIPRHAALGAFAALTIDCALGCLLNTVGSYLWPETPFFSQPIGGVAILSALWMPVSCTSAALTVRWVTRSKSHQIA